MPNQVAGVGTSAGPSVAVFGSDLYLAWKGEADETVWMSNGHETQPFSGVIGWSPERRGPKDARTDLTPVLAATESTLYMVWRNPGSDVDLSWSQSADGANWNAAQVIEQIGGSSNTPAFTCVDGVLYLAWKAEPGDDRIFWSRCSDGETWADQMGVPGVGGTSAGPALAGDSSGNLWLAWKGEPGDDGIYRPMLSNPASNTGWTPQQAVSGAATGDRPALATSSVGMAWKGEDGDSSVYVGLLPVMSPPLPARPVELWPATADFSDPVTLHWTDPLAGKPGAATNFNFSVFVNNVLWPDDATGSTGTSTTESDPLQIPQGSIQWNVQGVNNSGVGPWASANFNFNLVPTISSVTPESGNIFLVKGFGFTPNGDVNITIASALATATRLEQTSTSADPNGNISYSVNCSPLCAAAKGGGLEFSAKDLSSEVTSKNFPQTCQ